jgi:hypothetical protein
MKNLFDSNGRFINTDHTLGYTSSRNYFCLDKNIKSKIDKKKIYKNCKDFFKSKILISEEDFFKEINIIEKKISSNDDINQIENCVSIPFILPVLDSTDIGKNLLDIFIPALKLSYSSRFPKYEFINHIKDDLKNLLIPSQNSSYDKIIKNTKTKNLVGKTYLCLNEFSFSGAEKALAEVNNNFYLSGAYEVMTLLICMPELLTNTEKYPPLLWFSSMRHSENPNIGFHLEPYGYNLNLNKRAHLNLISEYWWHSLSITS